MQDVKQRTGQTRGNPIGLDQNAVFYADDTILVGTQPRELQKVLHAIEAISKDYGLRLNEKKCEHVAINNIRR
eukprot:10523062-Karenia_brevis.AAC.1